MSETDDYAIVYASGGEKDIQYLIDFSKKFQPRDLMRRSIGGNSDSDSISIGSTASEEVKKEDTEMSEPDNDDEDKRLWHILENPANRKFFLEHLGKSKEPILQNSEIKLCSKSFETLVNILVKLLEKLVHDKDYENLLLFLPLITKYYTRKDNSEEYLYSSFRKYTVWKELSLWENLMKVMYEKKLGEEQAKKKSNISNPIVNKLFAFGVKKINNILDNIAKPNHATPDKEIYISILHELSFYIGRLTKNLLISSEILIELAKDVIQDKREIKQLLSIQKDEVDEVLKLRISQVPTNKRKKAQNKWTKNFPFYLALEYLEPKDLVKILQLNKELRKAFKKRVYRVIFNRYGNDLQKRQRITIWKNILDLDSMNINYTDYLEQFVQVVATDKHIHQIEDVINIDVLRSFTNHKELSNQTLLKDLLKSYAMYDKEISYCQGMNYTMGYLYLQFENANNAFKAFCKIMHLFVKNLFDKDFETLKKCFFKFTRLLELFLPELAHHFQEEKVESSFYISAWFITIFTSSLQYTIRPKFIERVWDYFLLDGVKLIFKTALLIMMHFKEKLLGMKFDQILHFLSEVSKDEIFVNELYWMVIEGKLQKQEELKNFEFVENYSQNLRKVYITAQLLQLLDIDYEVFEVRLEKIGKSAKKN